MNKDWDDPLWEAEYEPGRLYKVEVIYFDHDIVYHAEVKYVGPWANPQSVNGFESLRVPQFEDVFKMLAPGPVKVLRVVE